MRDRLTERWRSLALRLVLVTGLLLLAARAMEVPLVESLLPGLTVIVALTDSRYEMPTARIVQTQAGRFIELKTRLFKPLALGQRIVTPQSEAWATVRTLTTSALQPLVPFLAIILAWPCPAGVSEALRRGLWAAPALAALLITNVPLGFNGMLLDFRELVPDAPVDLLVYWNDFLQTGGATVMGIGAALLVMAASARRRAASPSDDRSAR